jgi:hypothetical protein
MGHADEVEELRRSVLEGRAWTDPALRAVAFSGEHVPEPWTAYVTKVRNQSYRVTDEDVARLTAGGATEDWIFEVTVAAALGAAALRLEAGLAALSEAD